MIKPVVLMASPGSLMVLVHALRGDASGSGEDDDEDDDQDECSETDADTHGYLPPWSGLTCGDGRLDTAPGAPGVRRTTAPV